MTQELKHKAEQLAVLANDFNALIQSNEPTEALGLLRVLAKLRIELESLTEKAAYDDNVAKGGAA